MRFLIDRCAGRLLADWLRQQGHDVVESRELGPDPGDRALLDWAAKPDVSASERQLIIQDLLTRYETELQNAAIITVRGGRIRISKGPTQN